MDKTSLVGRTLNHYQIVEKLGSGGMGEVYVAEDTRLSRKVALKVLPAETASDSERRERFEREAKAVAALNHPNIVTVHSVEESEGIHFITMEWIRGQTLSEKIPAKGLPLARFFELAIPLVDAVSAAHKRGITHRDLKPDNIMVGEDGRVKVLDFGLVKLKEELGEDPMGSQLPTAGLTGEGRVIGTIAYMSPEQAEGKPVDHRSDIFSLGVVIYQMATGEQPFRGDTRISLISSILRDIPTSVTALNPGLPRQLGRIVRRSLAKDPEERYQTAQDLKNELMELKKEVESGEVQPEGAGLAGAPARRSRGLTFSLIAIGAIAAAGVGYLLLRTRGESGENPPPPAHGAFTQLTDQAGEEIFPCLSPDGKMLAYASRTTGSWDIFVQSVSGRNAVDVTKDSTADDIQPAFSPDGQKIAFRSGREGGGIFVMGILGDSVIRLTDSGYRPAWSPDGKEIAYETEGWEVPAGRNTTSQIWAVEVETGRKRKISDGDAVQPAWSPRGHRIAYWSVPKGSGQRDIFTMPAGGGDEVPVTHDAALDYNPVWSPDGRFLYFISDRDGNMNIWRVPLDEASGKVLGAFQSVTQGGTGSTRDLGVSGDGRRLVYSSTVVTRNLQKYSLDPAAGKVVGEPVWVTRGSEQVGLPGPSPDGQWLAYGTQGKQEDIFVVRADGTSRRQITSDVFRDRDPAWSPDGKKIAFYSNRTGNYQIWTVNPDGSGLHQLSDAPDHTLGFPVWSADGARMAATDLLQYKTFIFDPTKPWVRQTPQALPPYEETGWTWLPTSWSPDGTKLAGTRRRQSDYRGGVVTYDMRTQKYEQLTESGGLPVWLRDSRRLLFSDLDSSIFLLDSETKKVSLLLSLTPDRLERFSVRLSGDDRALFLVRVNPQSDVWMLSLD